METGKQQKGQINKPRKFYAHTDPLNPGKLPEQGANWQLLEEHLENVRKLVEDR